MRKDTIHWLRKAGFSEDRGYYLVWCKEDAGGGADGTVPVVRYELRECDDGRFTVAVTLAVESQSEARETSVWLFTVEGADAKDTVSRAFERTCGFLSSAASVARRQNETAFG